MKTRFILFLAGLSFCQLLPAQGIDYTLVIPSNPTASDTVRLVTAIWLPSGECWDENHVILQNQNQFDVTVGYNSGLLTVICHAVDTFELGRLDPGTYSGIYTALYPYPAVTWTGSAQFSFVVSGTVGHGEIWNGAWKVYPNPSTGEFSLAVPAQWQQESIGISLLDPSGRRRWSAQADPGLKQQVFRPGLAAGCYILLLETSSGIQYRLPLILTRP